MPDFIAAVQELYLSLRGGGLTLSPLDLDQIERWRAKGVPLELALRGVREAHAARLARGPAGRARPFRLDAAAPFVEALFAAYVKRTGVAAPHVHELVRAEAGDEPANENAAAAFDPLSACVESLRARSAGAAPAARAYAAALAVLEPLLGPSRALPLDRALQLADEAQALGYLRALPRPLQRKVAREAVREAGRRGRVPRRTHRGTLRAYLAEAARQHGGLVRASDLP